MKGKEPLKSQIFRAGTKFVVTDKSEDSTFGPGTTGYISYVKGFDQDFPNVVYLVVIVIRRGKGGKPRLDRAEISTPIFDLDDEELKSKMPDEKRRYYVHIKPIENTLMVTDMENINFMAWAASLSIFVHKLSQRAKHFKPWPQPQTSPLNMALLADEYWQEDEQNAISSLSNANFRQDFTMRIRQAESGLVKPGLTYLAKLSGLEEAAAKSILQSCDKNKLQTPIKRIAETINTAAKAKNHFGSMSTKQKVTKKTK